MERAKRHARKISQALKPKGAGVNRVAQNGTAQNGIAQNETTETGALQTLVVRVE